MRLNIHSKRDLALRLLLIAACTFMSWGKTLAANIPAPHGAAAIRGAGCKSLQADFDRVVASHAADPAVRAATQRLSAMDGLADCVLHDLRLNQSAFLDQNLATIGGADSPDQESPQLLGAAKIVETYRAAFAPVSVSSGLGDADRAVVAGYLRLGAQTLTTLIQSRGRECAAGGHVDVSEIVRLSFALEMLTTPENQTFSNLLLHLPAWMSNPNASRVLQTFAIESAFPRVAFAVATHAATSGPSDASAGYVAFVKREADLMLRVAYYHAALVCLRDGIAVANAAKMDADVVELSFRVAEVLEMTNSAQSAADEMTRVRSISHEPDAFARASMLRLKYLHAAGQYATVIAEASGDINEPLCNGCLPQIIYIAWATARELPGGDATTLRKQFLDRFPDHPIAAEIYFASATDAVAAGDFEGSSRLLHFIEYRFPQFRMINKVRELRERLSNQQKTNEPTAKTVAGGLP